MISYLSALVIILSSSVVFAASSTGSDVKAFETFDIYAAPSIGFSAGSYTAGSVDEGSNLGLHYAARLGFKLGPVLLGGEFGMVTTTRSSSSASSVGTASKIKYSVDNSNGTITSVGLNLGYMSDRIAFWLNYYPSTNLETTYSVISKESTNTYKGSGYSVELNFRTWDRLYVGVFANRFEYTKYSTNHSSGTVTDGDLDPNLKFKYYGFSVSYLFPLSEMKKISKLFPDMK